MSHPEIPEPVLEAARRRSAARAARDWSTADALRAEIEAAGWTVVDRGTNFRLRPAHPPTIETGGRVRYGASLDVPSRLADPPTATASIILVATAWPADVERAVAAIRATAPPGSQLVIVADDPSAEQAASLEAIDEAAAVAIDGEALAGIDVELVWTSSRLGHAAALNAGIRRAAGRTVVLLDASVEPTGDVVTPLDAALDDPTVAAAGGWGIVTADLRRFEAAPAGEVDAIEGYLLAFRRSDLAERGPLDEGFRYYRNLDIWWSFVLRDEGPARPPRRALALDLPARRHEHRGWTSLPEAERDRLSKRNFYRVLDRFRGRLDLASGAAAGGPPGGSGPER